MVSSKLSVTTNTSYETNLSYGTRPNNGTKKPDYGNRTIAGVIDKTANETPSRSFILVPRSNEPQDGWKTVSFGQVANAINFVAHKIVEGLSSIPRLNGDFPTVAYIGPNDLRYFIFMIACVKAGKQAFFISPRNSIEGQMSLFKATNCDVLCFASSYHDLIQPWVQERELYTFEVSSLETWLESDSPSFPYRKTAAEAEWDPMVVLHSSGSTGIPKPIVVRQGSFHMADALHHLPNFCGAEIFTQAFAHRVSKMLMPMPLFHAAGLMILSTMCVHYNLKLVLPVPGRPLGSDLMLQYLEHAGVDGAVMPPALIEELSTSEQGIEALKKLNLLVFGGGNLSTPTGNMLAERGVVLQTVISSTEYCPYLMYLKNDPKLWQYFVFNSEAMGIDWRPVSGEDGLYEMFIVRKDPDKPGLQTVFYTFPETNEFATKDVYERHPTLPDHWRWVGRADDIIVFSNGEKLNPVTIEDIVMGHPDVKGAMVVGQERFQPALVIEPARQVEGEEEVKAFIDNIWPTIEKANQQSVAHGRIARHLVMLALPEKSFLRAGKDTMQRAGTVKLYKDEVDQLYASSESLENIGAIELEIDSREALTQSIMNLFHTRLQTPVLEPDSEFFNVGVDSLQIINASKMLVSGLKNGGVSTDASLITPRVIYQHSTPKELAAYLYSIVEGKPWSPEGTKQGAPKDVSIAEELLKKYTEDLPAARPNKQDPLDENQTILLTGSTGSLGAYILDTLIASPSVKKVIALNRTSDSGSRQSQVSLARGLNTDFQKVEFLHAELSQPYLGLDQTKYDDLLAQVDRIIHNAWPVNFNVSLAAFAPHILGVRRLADFSAAAAKQVPVLFLSSIGTVDGWTEPRPIPEGAFEDLAMPSLSYGRSKQVSSLVLDAAARSSGISAMSVRVGQIAGPRGTKGMWNRQEFLPSLIASSLYLGVLPANLSGMEMVDWVPIEDMAAILVELVGVTTHIPVDEISGYCHAVNPCAISWTEVTAALMEFYAGRITKTVSMEDWVKALEASEGSTDDLDKNPAIKLLDTYRGMAAAGKAGTGYRSFAVDHTKHLSPTIRNLGPISSDLIKNWCKQWGF